MSIKSKLWFIYRWFIWIKDNLVEKPKINNINNLSIWQTVLQKTIDCYTFWKWPEKVLYLWWIHGNEVWTVKLMNKWVNYLSDNKNLYNDKQVFVIPCLNIDWYKKALNKPDYFNGWIVWKTNWNNVDLNRNFPTSNWSKKTKLFVAWKYIEVSGGLLPWSEPEIKSLLALLKKEYIKTIYIFHSCWSTVFSLNSSKRLKNYSQKSWYRVYDIIEWDKLIPEQKTWHSVIWWKENNIEIIEVEMKTRWWSEWIKNKEALIDSLSLK